MRASSAERRRSCRVVHVGLSDRAGAVRQGESAGVRHRRRLRRPGSRAGRGSRAVLPRRTECARAAASRPPRRDAGRPRRPRSSVGESGVHLAHGLVELADAGEARGERHVGEAMSVVSIRMRAVCARRARASASGPAPSSWVSRRPRCGMCSRRGPRVRPHPPGRRGRPRSTAWCGRPRLRRRPSRGCPAWRRAGTACRPGTRPPGGCRGRPERRRWRSRGCGPGSRAAVDPGGGDAV